MAESKQTNFVIGQKIVVVVAIAVVSFLVGWNWRQQTSIDTLCLDTATSKVVQKQMLEEMKANRVSMIAVMNTLTDLRIHNASDLGDNP